MLYDGSYLTAVSPVGPSGMSPRASTSHVIQAQARTSNNAVGSGYYYLIMMISNTSNTPFRYLTFHVDTYFVQNCPKVCLGCFPGGGGNGAHLGSQPEVSQLSSLLHQQYNNLGR